MPYFTKKIKIKSLGEVLIDARHDKGVGLDGAARDLKIAFKYLEALETNNLAGLPSKAQLRSYLKQYCRYLNIDFGQCYALAKNLARSGLDKKYFFLLPRYIKRIIIGLIVAAVLIFLFISIEKIFASPVLEIMEPKDGLITKERQITIVGRSQKEVEIVINNNNIFVDNKGNFQTIVDLQNGLNLIKITAKKRYGQPSEVNLRVLLNN